MDWQGLTTREWATVAWLVVLAAFVVIVARREVGALVRTVVTSWQMLATLASFGGWVALVCYVGHLAGAWDSDLMKDTVAWVLFYGCASLLSANRAAKEEQFFRRAALAALSVSALMQFVLNLRTFHVVVELVLLPVVTFLFMLEAIAGMDKKTRPAQNLVNWLLALVGLWVAVTTGQGLLDSWRGLDPEETGLAFAFSIWFPLTMLPFVYLLSLVMTYDKVFRLTSFRNDGTKPPLAVKVAILLSLFGNLRAVNDLPRHPAQYERSVVREASVRRWGMFVSTSASGRRVDARRRPRPRAWCSTRG